MGRRHVFTLAMLRCTDLHGDWYGGLLHSVGRSATEDRVLADCVEQATRSETRHVQRRAADVLVRVREGVCTIWLMPEGIARHPHFDRRRVTRNPLLCQSQ
jgi:hypothetical protein